jgi:hypothetical protein
MNQNKVHFIYIIPTDKDNVAEQAITNVALHLQAWYRWQLGGKTFTLTNPIVQVCHSTHDSTWFANNGAPDGDWTRFYWNNGLHELRALAGGGFGQPNNDWVTYIDAPSRDGQHFGGNHEGYCGVAVLSGKDVASVRGVDPDWRQCRGIGGCGHETGHTFGLPHPANRNPHALMWTGYSGYPNCILQDADKSLLLANPFFTSIPAQAPKGLCPFNQRPILPPRGKPARP